MSGTNQNPYPICIKCGTELNPQDCGGWEKLKKQDKTGLSIEDIWLCPNCIAKFQYVQDLPQIQKSEKYMPIIDSLFKIQSELKKINDNEAVG